MSRAPSDRGEDLGELGLADAGLALEEQRPAELERQEDRRRERAVGDVVALAEVGLDRLDGAGPPAGSRSVIGRITSAARIGDASPRRQPSGASSSRA